MAEKSLNRFPASGFKSCGLSQWLMAILLLFLMQELKAQKITWENLFRVSASTFEMKQTLVLQLGFDDVSRFETKVDNQPCQCLDCKRKMQNNLQGTWFENMIFCPCTNDIIYATENSTYYNELKTILKDRFSYLEVLENEHNGSSGGTIVFKKGNSTIEFMSQRKGDGFLQHLVKISGTTIEQDTETVSISKSRYFALIIAEEGYLKPELNLRYPKQNADALYKVLTEQYNFPKEQCALLDNSPTRSEIYSKLDKYIKLHKNDNLLIFFAGHGIYDRASGQGYWLTSDYSGNLSNSISNLDLTGYLRKIKSHHILVISDACYSGSIFNLKPDETGSRALSMNEIYSRKSRQALTSGELEPVPDKSTFFESLIHVLKNNQNDYLMLPDLVLNLEKKLIELQGSSIMDKHIYGRLSDAEDYGGEFIFIKK